MTKREEAIKNLQNKNYNKTDVVNIIKSLPYVKSLPKNIKIGDVTGNKKINHPVVIICKRKTIYYGLCLTTEPTTLGIITELNSRFRKNYVTAMLVAMTEEEIIKNYLFSCNKSEVTRIRKEYNTYIKKLKI